MTKGMNITQNRSVATRTRLSRLEMSQNYLILPNRGLYVKGAQALNLVRSWGIPTSPPQSFTKQKISKRPVVFRIRLNLSRKMFTPNLSIEYGQEPKVISGTETVGLYMAFRMGEPADEVKRRVQVLCEREWGSFGPKIAFPEIIDTMRTMFLEKEGKVFRLAFGEGIEG